MNPPFKILSNAISMAALSVGTLLIFSIHLTSLKYMNSMLSISINKLLTVFHFQLEILFFLFYSS